MCPAIDHIDVVNRSRENLILYLLSKIFITILYMLRTSDLCIDLYGGKSSILLTRISRSKNKIIVAAGNYAFNGKISSCKRRSRNLTEMPMSAMCALSSEVYSLLPYIRAPQSAECGEGAYDWVLENAKKLYVINVGAGDAKKIPDINKLVLLCSNIADKHGLTPILLKNPDSGFYQKQLAASFEAAGLNYFQMIDVLNFHQIAYLLRRSRFFVTPDTGLMHLAIGLGVPTLAIFPFTNPSLIEIPGANLQTCFVENSSDEYHDGLPVGDRDIPVELMIRQFEILYRRNHLDGDSAV
jgi:ADP-heptose:LPS heptosyltransferase